MGEKGGSSGEWRQERRGIQKAAKNCIETTSDA